MVSCDARFAERSDQVKAAAVGVFIGAILVDNIAVSGMLIAGALVFFALAKVGEWLR